MFRKIEKDGNVTDFGKLIKPSSLDIKGRLGPVRVDAKGNVYTTDANGALYVIDPTTYIAKQIQIPIDLKLFRFIMDVDDAGHVYLTDTETGNERTPFSFYKIKIITGEIISKIDAEFPSPDSGQLNCMKVDTLGDNLYFSFYADRIVYKLNFKSLEINALANLDVDVQSLSTDENKNVYASSPSDIYKIDPSGNWKRIY